MVRPTLPRAARTGRNCRHRTHGCRRWAHIVTAMPATRRADNLPATDQSGDGRSKPAQLDTDRLNTSARILITESLTYIITEPHRCRPFPQPRRAAPRRNISHDSNLPKKRSRRTSRGRSQPSLVAGLESPGCANGLLTFHGHGFTVATGHTGDVGFRDRIVSRGRESGRVSG